MCLALYSVSWCFLPPVRNMNGSKYNTEVKIMKIRTLLAVFAALLALVAAPAVSHADQLADIQKRGVLRVAVPQDYPPFGFVGPDMQMHGYDVEMARYIANFLGVKCEFVPATGANRIPFMQSGRADIIISTLGKTAERVKVIDFAMAYAPTYLGVFGPASAKISGPADLKGHVVGVTRGNIEDQLLTDAAPEGVSFKRYEDTNTTSQAYLSGQTEFICTLNFVAGALTMRTPEARKPVLKFELRNSPNYVGMRQNEPALKEALNKAITKAYEDGTLKAFCEKFLQSPLPEGLIYQEPGN